MSTEEITEGFKVAASYGVQYKKGIRLLYYFCKELKSKYFKGSLQLGKKYYASDYLGIAYIQDRGDANTLQFAHCFRIQLSEQDDAIPLKICLTDEQPSLYLNQLKCIRYLYFYDVFTISLLWRLPWYCSYDGMEDQSVFAYRSTHTEFPKLVVPFVGKKNQDLTRKQKLGCCDLPSNIAPMTYVLTPTKEKHTRGSAYGLLVPFNHLKNRKWSLGTHDLLRFDTMLVIRDSARQGQNLNSTHPLDPPLLNSAMELYGLFLCEGTLKSDAVDVIPQYTKDDRIIMYTEYSRLICKPPSHRPISSEANSQEEVEWEGCKSFLYNPKKPIVLYHKC